MDMILGQGGVKMMLVDRYDHRIYLGRKKTMLKRNRIDPIVVQQNLGTQVMIRLVIWTNLNAQGLCTFQL
jgi:hypothetical protein